MKISKPFLYILSFIAGFITLSLEMLGFRMLAPYFGYSIYVSGSLIGIILITLTIGYYLGGILADKKPEINFMLKLVLIADIYIFIIALAYNRILQYLSHLGLIAGTLVSTLIIFGLPMILLSTVSPYLIKNLSSNNTVGKTTGSISALSTLGNIAGVFITTFIFVPNIGTHKTIYILAITLLVISLYWLCKKNKKYVILFSYLFLINTSIPLGPNDQNTLYLTESEYNIVKVIEQNNKILLILNNDKWTQSVANKNNNILVNNYYDLFNIAPIINNGSSVLILGMGSGTCVNQYRRIFPNIEIDAVEIDQKVIETAYKFFNLPRNDPKLNVYNEDAKTFLRKTDKKYDIIVVDIYQGDIYVPFYLVTREFFMDVNTHLTDNGILVMNIIRLGVSEYENNVYNAISNTIASVFPSEFSMKVPKNNAVILATKKYITKENMLHKMGSNNIKGLDGIMKFGTSLIEEVKPNERFMVLTDDFSPVEKITYKMYKESIYKTSNTNNKF